MVRTRLFSLWRHIKRVTLLAWDGFWANNCTLAASSLAYQTALALVPLLAIALALLKASGQLDAGSQLVSYLVKAIFPSSTEAQSEVVERLSSFSGNITAGALGSFGLITSSIIGFLLFLSVESIWNRIWDSQRERGYIERFLFFYTGITLFPLVAAVWVLHTASLWDRHLVSRLLLSLATTAAGATLLNRFLPTLRVDWRPALIGSAISAGMMELCKFGLGLYLSYITGKYRTIYGALAVLPLFLLSIYLWWVILLWGAEVCRAIQRLPLLSVVTSHVDEEDGLKPGEMPTMNGPLAMRLLFDVAQHWKRGARALPIVDLEKRHGLPESFVRRAMKRFINAGWVVETEDSYLLSRPPDDIRLDEVIRLFKDFSSLRSGEKDGDALDRVLFDLEGSVRSQLKKVTLAQLL
ncbi:MAG: YihY family inner membrane protein [Myxococcales bacterium]|nr:YihY family inner membrane protein [Myxococcales bacterium]